MKRLRKTFMFPLRIHEYNFYVATAQRIRVNPNDVII